MGLWLCVPPEKEVIHVTVENCRWRLCKSFFSFHCSCLDPSLSTKKKKVIFWCHNGTLCNLESKLGD